MHGFDWFVMGLGLGLLVSIVLDWQYRRILVMKAHPLSRTPEKLEGKFYYIVPEREYVERMRNP